MNSYTKKILVICAFIVSIVQINAQCDAANSLCAKHLQDEFISDGQNYQALLVEEDLAEFQTTFFKGVTYRVAACSGDQDGQLTYRVYDKNRKLIFSSMDYEDSPYWNFVAEDNFDCIIEAKLLTDKLDSGCAVILIGFKN